ncbi:MAG: hydrolase Nlp/P60 [Flavobacteriaceae bacterium CG_4_8_14_3_um_filter_34_10]|nr:C40 family peptidase [Flavobacteriia bacterium]PIQ18753.1 MAG: hydrolase Nlp/P60 [Flavobacteriaceae bacterium CG18_big_fil_WC_8_21_14_2_50_34_36]PIV48340.1 MAG: hydrolase Nlp/P60 [Flavobacteriaceae bacterium CG02_land_8_20_14_3_00_34_13]PIX08807.1 MAG: hydrolase Nlp/P60 [Flavobacteriaceae bacterium CG_4_8_14_3_um_filter_34_10]PIZ07269.1 MAG: hydrolase Nlp/P60 [Flavobacteriaceae bacterium CG_4_10_14_0_8_um_filter_34_31]PJC08192.1 MAG: hydrolase Nlp/P60 [Flavobacteriaceae bacterium CG_4_9_14_
MKYGLCNLSVIPLRLDPSNTSEMVSQLLYGEHFKIIEERNGWCYIRLAFDGYEGWIDHKQYTEISAEVYHILDEKPSKITMDIMEFITNEFSQLVPIPLGSHLNASPFLKHTHDGNVQENFHNKANLIRTALLYLNTPYLWGGKTPFGIDCSGFTQMVYKLNGFKLLRDAKQQATQGESLSFIEESEPGDLAFFDNNEGCIVHVGIIMNDNYIIHAHGKVRIDRLDHSGIFNLDTGKHTHQLRVIKKII